MSGGTLPGSRSSKRQRDSSVAARAADPFLLADLVGSPTPLPPPRPAAPPSLPPPRLAPIPSAVPSKQDCAAFGAFMRALSSCSPSGLPPLHSRFSSDPSLLRLLVTGGAKLLPSPVMTSWQRICIATVAQEAGGLDAVCGVVRRHNRQSAESVRAWLDALFTKRLAAGVSFDHVEVSLLCPATQCRLRVPARTTSCDHLQCFELEWFLHSRSAATLREARRAQAEGPTAVTTAAWLCPICRRPADFFRLFVDGYMEELVREAAPAEKVLVLKGGGWKAVDAPAPAAAVVELGDDSDGESDGVVDVTVTAGEAKAVSVPVDVEVDAAGAKEVGVVSVGDVKQEGPDRARPPSQ